MKIWLDTLRTQTRFMRDIGKIIAILKDASIPRCLYRRLRAEVLQVRSEAGCGKEILRLNVWKTVVLTLPYVTTIESWVC